ncbi:MAG: hypothetical protein NC211_03625 [Alistipes senegalensis]|nr:hypothetical protein [Oxalobacter formigenes]MCM1280908.1 hypothetical protein [Alistipes senegalensis]
MNVTNELLRGALKRRVSEAPILDDAKTDGTGMESAADYTIADIKMSAAAAVQEWAETDDLAEGEGYAGRLMALMVGIADENKDGEITDDEQAVLNVALEAAWDYLVKLGVSEDDADSLLNDWEEETADRVRDLVAGALPDGEDEAGENIDSFVFGDEDQEPLMDAVLDAAYRKVVAVRQGKKVRVRKRISGQVRLSGAQKIAIKKARMKSHSAKAKIRRMKSMRLRKKAGL